MKIGILISTNDPETLWNAFRFANLCMNTDVNNEVSIFLHSKAVEYESWIQNNSISRNLLRHLS